MSIIQEQKLEVAGIATRTLAGGSDSDPVVLFLHSNVPGITPYCGGAHVWGRTLADFAQQRRVIALDCLGSGGTGQAPGALTVNAIAEHAIAFINTAGLRNVHLIGHDLGGLAALLIAMDQPALLASLTIVASPWAAPSGDGVDNLTLSQIPEPRWSRQSQAWALERLSYSHQHIDEALLDASVAAAGMPAHRAAVAAMVEGYGGAFNASVHKTKSRFFRVGREQGLAMPMQVVAAKQDPMVSPDHSLWLFKIAAQHQKASQFHLLNRCGAFPFREQPDEFHHVVAAFQDGLLQAAA